ncbi:hypothetical protein SLEP1_g39609 [Rubroshorea leprosula]|uniref:Uncharacterized protein n=1 Tax=Rubroshorea leprosula TaxID=152421 RepID=A0AAV5L1F3_9ROSI|nr:hypothetical protein SLEP1_g39609 [Rubroshorea leprosula]
MAFPFCFSLFPFQILLKILSMPDLTTHCVEKICWSL